MKELKLTIDRALDAYKNGSADHKKLLIDLYGEEHFITDIKERVTSYESACKVLNKTPLSIDNFKFLGEKQAKKEFARHKIITGIEAINQGWIADFDDENVYKYYNYFYNKRNGFSSCVDGVSVISPVGSDLCIETRDKAEYIAKIFREDYIIYLF